MSRAKLWTYNGISKTLDEWADDIGMTASALRHRLKLGWDFDKAISTPHNSYRYEYKGNKYTMAELAKMNGTITIAGMESRIHRGMSVKDAVEMPFGLNKPAMDVRTPNCKCDFNCFGCTNKSCY